MKSIILFFISMFSFVLLNAQNDVPVLSSVVPGSGIYLGLKMCPKPCSTAAGDFYVSSAYEPGTFKWFKLTSGATGVTSKSDGLTNTKNLLKLASAGYNIDVDATGLPANINGYVGISSPATAIEKCFRKNYDVSGNLISGTTAANMWYLPALDELMLMYSYFNSNSTVFTAALNGDNWSSSEDTGDYAFRIYHTGYFGSNATKSAVISVRCIRH